MDPFVRLRIGTKDQAEWRVLVYEREKAAPGITQDD